MSAPLPGKLPFNKLSSAEAERLALLSEECGEVVQAIGKILRHGYASYHPLDPNGLNNRKSLEKEIGDVRAAVAIMRDAEDISDERIREFMQDKLIAVPQYLHHQKAIK